MKIIKEYKENIPGYALSYLINNDSSGIDQDDKQTIDKWMEFYERECNPGESIVINPINDDSFFSRYPAFGFPCDCIECSILILG